MLKFPVRRLCSAASRQVQNCNHYEEMYLDNGDDQDEVEDIDR